MLGLELVHRQRQENEYTQRLVGFPGAVLEVAQFKVPGLDPRYSTHMFELVEYVEQRGEHLPLPTTNVGVAHHVDAAPDLAAFLAVKTERHPAGRILQPEDVAEVIVFVLDERAIGVNGALVTIDGGLTATFDFSAG